MESINKEYSSLESVPFLPLHSALLEVHGGILCYSTNFLINQYLYFQTEII